MSVLKNDRYLRAALRQPVDCTPVWMMRQAGRYLPEYRATRAQAGSFMQLCTTPDLACEVTLQPLRRFELDAAILFSDILTVPDAMGLGLHFETGEGPRFDRPVRSAADVAALPIPDPENETRYVMDAVRTIRRELNGSVPLIGFGGSPWTIATYMVEGCGSKEYAHIKGLMYAEPKTLHALLAKLSQTLIAYLTAQVHAGAQALMIFDTWGGVLTPPAYEEFSLRYMSEIVAALPRSYNGQRIPITLFTKGGGSWLPKMADTGADMLGVDWTTPLAQAKVAVAGRCAVQGNLDPGVLYGTPERIRAEVATMLASFGHGSGHVANLGHGIHQFVNPENAKVFVDAVHELSRPYHQ